MADLSAADDGIRNDYLAARGAAPQAAQQQAWQGLIGGGKPAPALPPPIADFTGALPIGKRIMSTVGSFLYDRLPEAFKGPSAAEQMIAEGQRTQAEEQRLGRPLSLQERLQLNPVMQSPAALGFGTGAIGGETVALARRGATPAGEAMPVAPMPPIPLADELRARLGTPGGDAASPTPGTTPLTPQTAPEGTVAPPAEPAAPARDILALGNPLEPAVTVHSTPQTAAQAEVTLGRMEVEGEPPEGETRPSPYPPRVATEPPPEPIRMSDETIHDYLAGARVDNPVKVNLARIGSGEDIADALEQVSKTIPEQAVQSNLATKAAADALGMRPDDLIAGYKGEQLNAAQTTAMRFMLDSSAQQLIDYAKAAREPMASGEAQAQFLKAFTVHRSLQQYFENARAEAGRTLQSWSIMSQQRADYTRAVGELIQRVDANGDLSHFADQVADMDNPLQVSRLVAQSMQGTGRDKLMTIMYNARLSSPTTVVKKLTSDVGMAMWNTATRYAAEKLSSGAVAPGETGALIQGYIGSFGDAVRAGGQALKAGESQFWKDYQSMDSLDLSEVGGSAQQVGERINRRFRMSALANGVPTEAALEQPTRSAFSYIRSALPTSWIGAADDFAKVWQYQANRRALAVRAAEGDQDKFTELLDTNPPWLHQQALSDTLKYTFQEPLTGIAANLRDTADAFNVPVPGTSWEIPVGRVVMPFVKVPANIARMAYRSSPLAYVFRSPSVRAALANPGAERDILLAQMGLGTGITLGLTGLALNGNLTGKGPSDPGLRSEWEAAGNRPYSLQVPGAKPIQLNQIEPFGMTLGAVADTVNLIKFSKEQDAEHLALSLGFGIGQAALSKTYYQGTSDLLDALAHPDQNADRYTSRLIAGLVVPQGVQRLASATDEWQRAHYGIMDGIEANLPMVREGLPPARTLWGDPIPTREAYLPFMSGHAASLVSPIGLGPDPASSEPIDRWIWDNRDAFPREQETQRGISKPARTQSYSAGKGVSAQVELTPTEYDRFQVLAGNELKDPATGMGAKDTLNAYVTGMHPSASAQRMWDDGSPAERALVVQSVVSKYRAAAKQQLRQEFPDIETAIQASWGARAAALKGAGAIQ
jgi:hypothetical protein